MTQVQETERVEHVPVMAAALADKLHLHQLAGSPVAMTKVPKDWQPPNYEAW